MRSAAPSPSQDATPAVPLDGGLGNLDDALLGGDEGDGGVLGVAGLDGIGEIAVLFLGEEEGLGVEGGAEIRRLVGAVGQPVAVEIHRHGRERPGGRAVLGAGLVFEQPHVGPFQLALAGGLVFRRLKGAVVVLAGVGRGGLGDDRILHLVRRVGAAAGIGHAGGPVDVVAPLVAAGRAEIHDEAQGVALLHLDGLDGRDGEAVAHAGVHQLVLGVRRPDFLIVEIDGQARAVVGVLRAAVAGNRGLGQRHLGRSRGR